MNLTIINGSPRGIKSNSNLIASWFSEALEDQMTITLHHAAKTSLHQEIAKSIKQDHSLLIVFPLYTDSVPYVLKALLEEMELHKHQYHDINVYFVVQSGFGGAKHSRAVEAYLQLASKLLGMNYMGTAIRPSSEGLRLYPPAWTQKPQTLFHELADDIKQGIPFNKDTLAKLIPYETPPWHLKLAIRLGLGDMYFKNQQRRHKVFKQRYRRPYKKNSV